jgi:iron complex transport system substrate-binding protein
MKKIYFLTFCIIVTILAIAPICTAARTVTVTDMAGRQVIAPFDPDRIVCIGPGALRLIVYLQAVSKVAGVEDMEKMNPGGRPYWIAHPELSQLPCCGPGGPAGINKKPDLEALLAVKPQVIFITYMDASLAEEVQRTLGIPLVVLSYGAFATFDEAVYDAMRIAGKILNREKRADDVVTYIESLRKDMRMRTKDIPEKSRPTVYVGGIGYRGAHGIESTEQRYIPFEWIGANNIAEHAKVSIGSHVTMDKETLLKLNPDVIFIDGGGLILVVEDYRKKPEFYNALKAFSNRQVYTLHPFNWYTTNIGTALADAYTIGKILYEKQFEDVDPQRKADEIYTFLVGKPIMENMQKDYGSIGQEAPFLN